MANFFRKTYQSWMDKRLPQAPQIELTQKRLFVLPSRNGLLFLGLQFLLILVGINYQNNLAYALCFFLFSLFLSAIMLTFFNLKGLIVEWVQANPVFVGESAAFNLRLTKTTTTQHHRLQLGFKGQPVSDCNLVADNEVFISLPVKAVKRGRLKPAGFFIKTQYPLGMVTCWSNLRMPLETIVYPAPIFKNDSRDASVEGDAPRQTYHRGDEDFYGFKAYEAGDSPSRLNWRGLAKGQALTTKVYQSGQDTACWVDWYSVEGKNTEEKLSILCGQILMFHQCNQAFGLRLPNLELVPDSTFVHYHKALTALALYS